MKNNGFTLMELIAVVCVLSLVAIIVTPTVLDSLKESKERTYVNQTRTLEKTAEKWSIKNTGLLSETDDYYLSIDTLVNEDYLNADDIIDPRDHSKMDGCIIIHYDTNHSQYNFTYTENTCSNLSQQ